MTDTKAERRAAELERLSRGLLRALDRMYGNLCLSQNVLAAASLLRSAVTPPPVLDPADFASRPAEAPRHVPRRTKAASQ